MFLLFPPSRLAAKFRDSCRAHSTTIQRISEWLIKLHNRVTSLLVINASASKYPGVSRCDVCFLSRSGKYPAVDVLVRENFRQRRYRQIFGVGTMQYRHRERVDEHLRIDAIATVDRHRKEVLVRSHTCNAN